MSGIKYLNFIADIFGVSAANRRERIRKYSELFELTADLAQPIAAYSHGMKQKLAIIAAWLHSPKLIIMDEPFVGLDPKASHLLKGMMREVCDEGGAIFFSTHVLEVAEKLCDKVAIIKGGKLVRSGTMEDMYGDLHENIVLWDAEEYAQKNPLFTDENGMYAWDVPQGLWQVKFEKEGYQTTYSEWLPVPPPQLEVNIGMVQNVQPEVKSAKAYEDGVEVEFSKYMKPETLTADNLYLKLITGSTEEMVKDVTVDMLNVEAVSEDDATQYVSKVALKTTKDLGLVDEVYVIVGNAVQSYAGIPMAETFTQKLDVEKKVREIVAEESYNVGYEQAQTITVGALPNDASKGKTLMVKAF